MPPNPSDRRDAAPTVSPRDATGGGWLALIGFLFVARYLRPEDASYGGTLWISTSALALATLWFWQQARQGRRSLRFGVPEICLWGLALAHVLASTPVFLEGGNRRAAANVTWEWIGLAATFLLIRQLAGVAQLRRMLLTFVATTTALAGLGVWQYHVAIPELAGRYAELRVEEKALLEQAGPSDYQRLADVREELASFNVPREESARIRWENRLRYSTEPFATFALANTLAGLLAAALPLLFMSAVGGNWSWRRWIVLGAGVLVLYCLILTKSRTAWVGLAAGTFVGMAWQLARGWSLVRLVSFGGIAFLLAMIGAFAAWLTGGLDREVLSQAAMSMRYRLEYWTGTLGVLAEHPWLGTGPANFRSYYMQHRPVGASEEIAGPHNLFLEIWVAGGLLGLLLLVGLLAFLAWRLVGQRRQQFPGRHEGTSGLTGIEWGGLAAFIVVPVLYFAAGSLFDWRLICIAPLFWLLAVACNRSEEQPGLWVGLLAGLVALLVHLLGADGIEFPVVIQTLFLFAMILDRPGSGWAMPAWCRWFIPVGLAVLTTGMLLTGLVPVLNATAYMNRAESLLATRQSGAGRAIEAAIAADPWSRHAVMMKAQLETNKAMVRGTEAAREEAIAAWRNVLAADPRNVFARERIAAIYLAAARDDGNIQLARKAAGILEEAVTLSPTQVELRVELARAWRAGGKPIRAAEAARSALLLDSVNRERGHSDLVLGEKERRTLEKWRDLGGGGVAP